MHTAPVVRVADSRAGRRGPSTPQLPADDFLSFRSRILDAIPVGGSVVVADLAAAFPGIPTAELVDAVWALRSLGDLTFEPDGRIWPTKVAAKRRRARRAKP
jgi:hypothetical protein